MEAVILAVGMIAFASFLTFNHPAESKKKLSRRNNNTGLTKNPATPENKKTEKSKEQPYYERFISRVKNNDFLDYSGGMMGI